VESSCHSIRNSIPLDSSRILTFSLPNLLKYFTRFYWIQVESTGIQLELVGDMKDLDSHCQYFSVPYLFQLGICLYKSFYSSMFQSSSFQSIPVHCYLVYFGLGYFSPVHSSPFQCILVYYYQVYFSLLCFSPVHSSPF